MEFMFDWEDGDRFSFEDSDRFEEDSLCSWLSETESICNNWRGWKKGATGGSPTTSQPAAAPSETCDEVLPLVELAARTVAFHIPFEVVENVYPPVPENLQLRISFWSFPENEDDIRLYSCLANGSPEEFQKGELLLKNKAVKEVLQIGFHLSGTIGPSSALSMKDTFNVAITFYKRCITTCSCTCTLTGKWCSHVVALCLYRIINAENVCLRAPVSESLSRLHRDQLQKFAQYLISELPQQILPTAQRLLDELLSSQANTINTVRGAPDPTAGPPATESSQWYLDDSLLHENIKKTLLRFCGPGPLVFSDVNSLYLSNPAPAASAEWTNLLRPLRGREPEGVWNLLSIIRELFRRRDSNAIFLLKILTEECISCEQVVVWWFSIRTSAIHSHHGNHGHRAHNNNSSSMQNQHSCASMCDEIVTLWRYAALNPANSPAQRKELDSEFRKWHLQVIESSKKGRRVGGGGANVRKVDMDVFAGFKPAIEACLQDWNDFPIEGVTYSERRSEEDVCNETDKHPLEASPECSYLMKDSDSLHSNDTKHAAKLSQNRQKSEECDSDFIAVDSSDSRGDETENISQSVGVSHDLEGDDESESANEDHGARRKNKSKHSDKNSPEKNLGIKQKNDADSDGSNDRVEASNLAVAAALNADPKDAAAATAAGAAAAAAPEGKKVAEELNVYFYDTKSKVQESPKKKKDEVCNPFNNVKKIEDKMQIQFNHAEALYVHGHSWYAYHLAIQLAEEMIVNPPKLDTEVPTGLSNKGKKRYLHQQSTLASQLLSKISFLCSVLAEQPECHNLAFKIGLLGLQITRQPASTKGLEVKLANQESELVVLLKRVPLGAPEMEQLRELSEQMRNWSLQKHGEGVLPLMLAGYIFEAMCLTSTASSSRSPSKSILTTEHRQGDEVLGFEAAVSALAMKSNVSEAAHPLLCEGTRRQRGDLALSMLMHYRDDQTPLRRILDAFLDKQHLGPAQKVVQCIPSSIAPNKPSFLSTASRPTINEASRRDQNHRNNAALSPDSRNPSTHEQRKGSQTGDNKGRTGKQSSERLKGGARARLSDCDGADEGRGASPRASPEEEHIQGMLPQENSRKGAPMVTGWEEEASGANVGVPLQVNSNQSKWDRIFGRQTKRSREMASIDSSAPETTSSDNSPALGRRFPPPGGWGRHQGPGSDSGSSGNSSDSLSSSSSWDKPPTSMPNEAKEIEGAIGGVAALRVGPCVASEMNESRSSTPSPRNGRFRGKNRVYCPSIPNQPSEASAHFYLELAKTIVTKAGGNSSPTHFTQNPANNNQSGPHRGLLLTAFEVGFYALSLYNAVSPNWLTRTYSAYESFIRSQALELGSGGINILVNYWEGHLTPAEAAAIADRASRCRDPQMVQAAAELALSCLSHAHALNPSDVNRALLQCKEQDVNMLSKACLAVENAAKGGDVYPDVLFTVGKHWEWLHNQTQHHRDDEASSPPEDNMVAAAAVAAHGMHPPIPPYNEPVIPIPVSLYHTYPVQYGPRPTHPPHPPYHPARPGFIPHNQPPTSQAMPGWGVPAYPPCSNPYVAIPSGFASRAMVGPNPNLHQYVGGAPPVPAMLPAPGRVARGGSPALVPAPVVPHQSQYYLLHTYRVGMLAMDTLARRVHDERYQSRFSRNPPYGEDVKWLLGIAKKLGASHVQQYCFSVPNIIFSPYVLQEIVTEAAQFLSNVHHTPLQNTLRSPTLTHIIQKCQQMYMQCIHQRMNNMSQHEYEEVLTIMRNAQSAFLMSPCGANQFQDFLNNLHRMKPGKREFLTRIISSLSFGNIYEHTLSNR
ncbi:zinc finger SWIM domain-containing protein 8-like isoform X2 [Anneissia japonica]|uniref:zinc finger SWIM domain-containing protein 8-like isoform X2 n=1 Tax=Anneissia japonica TaxID=1529436 RepID=UPI001425A797|nr:zinc finger SWIM domain-containing protein 8-like isoform X2 [Anneissia japonica]